MIRDPKFDDIRPYYSEEIPQAMERIAGSEFFPLLASYVFPGEDVAAVGRMVGSIGTSEDFQRMVMLPMGGQVIERSISAFTYSGLENLDRDTSYLFVSNHRDIVLDSALMQRILYLNGHRTTEITFGANLMSNQLVIDIGKANKMFKVERGGSRVEFYQSSRHLSDYIRHCISEKGASVWIAQRNGRTKDGVDATDAGLVKMLSLSGCPQLDKAVGSLRIVPVSVSYQWEPCDILKALELYQSRRGPYVKKPGEDMNSIITGIMEFKGRMHVHFSPPVGESDLGQYVQLPRNEFNRAVARHIDRSINGNYSLMDTNYIAHDIANCDNEYADMYTDDARACFVERLHGLSRYSALDVTELTDIFLGIYANPVDSHKDATVW